MFGPEVKLWQHPLASSGEIWRLSFIAGAGATTPLDSSQVTINYNAPPPATTECAQLVQRFGQKSGYVPYLVANPNQGSTGSCIYNPVSGTPYKFVSFANQNRTNFLFKWGMGGRLTHVYPAKGTFPSYSGSIDFGVGQDASVTGGAASGWVGKIDAVYPLAFGGSSYLYVFGSAAMRFKANQQYPPLILSTGTMVPTPPDPSVIVLPLKQPNRDFYSLGFGLNLASIWCKFASTGCPKESGDNSASDNGSQTAKAGATAATAPATNKSGSGKSGAKK